MDFVCDKHGCAFDGWCGECVADYRASHVLEYSAESGVFYCSCGLVQLDKSLSIEQSGKWHHEHKPKEDA